MLCVGEWKVFSFCWLKCNIFNSLFYVTTHSSAKSTTQRNQLPIESRFAYFPSIEYLSSFLYNFEMPVGYEIIRPDYTITVSHVLITPPHYYGIIYIIDARDFKCSRCIEFSVIFTMLIALCLCAATYQMKCNVISR